MTATITDLFCGAGGSFARRARQEREIGHAICSTEVRINGRRDKIPVFLDELEPPASVSPRSRRSGVATPTNTPPSRSWPTNTESTS